MFLFIDRFCYVVVEYWLATWTSAEEDTINRFGVELPSQAEGISAQYFYIMVYAITLVCSFVGATLRSQWIIQGGGRSSQRLFDDMMRVVIPAPMSFFETTPIGRILNRFSYDVEVLDIKLSESMTFLCTSTGWFVTGVVLQITILPWILFALVPITCVYWLLLLHYRKSAVDLQRLDSVSRSPLQARLAEGIDGSSTIRVFNKTDYFESHFKAEMDNNTSAMMNFLGAQRWVASRYQLIGSIACLFSSCFIVAANHKLKLEPGIVAMLLIWSSNFTITLSFFSNLQES